MIGSSPQEYFEILDLIGGNHGNTWDNSNLPFKPLLNSITNFKSCLKGIFSHPLQNPRDVYFNDTWQQRHSTYSMYDMIVNDNMISTSQLCGSSNTYKEGAIETSQPKKSNHDANFAKIISIRQFPHLGKKGMVEHLRLSLVSHLEFILYLSNIKVKMGKDFQAFTLILPIG